MTPAETTEDRDARLERLALERDRAVWLLKEWDKATIDLSNLHRLSAMLRDTRKFLEGLT